MRVTDIEGGREQTFTLVGPTEADLKAGKLSAESPVARALMGAAPGDVVEVESPAGRPQVARRRDRRLMTAPRG